MYDVRSAPALQSYDTPTAQRPLCRQKEVDLLPASMLLQGLWPPCHATTITEPTQAPGIRTIPQMDASHHLNNTGYGRQLLIDLLLQEASLQACRDAAPPVFQTACIKPLHLACVHKTVQCGHHVQ